MTEREKNLKIKSEKLPLDKIYRSALEDIAKVRKLGAEKYGDYENWKQYDYDYWKAPLMRHVVSLVSGEDYDPESGFHHGAHIMTNVMYMIEKKRMEDEEKLRRNMELDAFREEGWI